MGHWAYCKRCKVPVKADDTNDYTYCEHGAKHLDYDVFSRASHDDIYLYGWNLRHPEFMTSRRISYGYEKSPYIGKRRPKEPIKQIKLHIMVAFNDAGVDYPWQYIDAIEELGHTVEAFGKGHPMELFVDREKLDLVLEIETPSRDPMPYRGQKWRNTCWVPAACIAYPERALDKVDELLALKAVYHHGVFLPVPPSMMKEQVLLILENASRANSA